MNARLCPRGARSPLARPCVCRPLSPPPPPFQLASVRPRLRSLFTPLPFAAPRTPALGTSSILTRLLPLHAIHLAPTPSPSLFIRSRSRPRCCPPVFVHPPLLFLCTWTSVSASRTLAPCPTVSCLFPSLAPLRTRLPARAALVRASTLRTRIIPPRAPSSPLNAQALDVYLCAPIFVDRRSSLVLACAVRRWIEAGPPPHNGRGGAAGRSGGRSVGGRGAVANFG